MDYYEPKSKSTEPDYIQFAELVDFYYPGGQQNESEKAAPEAPKDPVSRRPSEPVRNTPEPASAPTKPSSPQKPAGIFASIRRGFQEGVEKAKSERRARSGSDSDEKKKTSKVKSALETAKKEVSRILQRADEVVLSGVQAIDRFLRRNG